MSDQDAVRLNHYTCPRYVRTQVHSALPSAPSVSNSVSSVVKALVVVNLR